MPEYYHSCNMGSLVLAQRLPFAEFGAMLVHNCHYVGPSLPIVTHSCVPQGQAHEQVPAFPDSVHASAILRSVLLTDITATRFASMRHDL